MSKTFWESFMNLSGNPYVLNSKMSSLKCLLVFPTIKTKAYTGDYPIALGYMASLLRMNGADTEILIQDIDSYDRNAFFGFDIITFFPMVSLLNQILDCAEFVKKDFPETKICMLNSEQHQHEMLLCSPKAVGIARNIMERFPSVDFILVGEAEYSFLKLCEKLTLGDEGFSELPSCLYREDGLVKVSIEPIRPVDFKYLPFPARDFLERTISDENVNVFSPRIQSSRGCMGRCIYCAESSSNITNGGREKIWAGRDIVKFVDEIEYLSEKYKVVFFNIIDSSFEDPGVEGLERMRMFCSEINERGIQASFKIHLRMETITKLSDEFILTLKKTGVDVLIIGAESGLEHELRSYRKRTTVQKNITNCLRLERFDKFFLLIGHMMFSPVLKLDDLPHKIEFLKKVEHGWDYMNVSNNLLVFNGTAYHDFIREKGLEIKNNELTGTAAYKYEDERVKYVAEEMGSLKVKCPDVIWLNNNIYEALNVKARFSNEMNRHLWHKVDEFDEFTRGLKRKLIDIERVFSKYFYELVTLAESDWNEKQVKATYELLIASFIPDAASEMEKLISGFINKLEGKGLSTSKLYLKTWMSIINTEVNTAGGKT